MKSLFDVWRAGLSPAVVSCIVWMLLSCSALLTVTISLYFVGQFLKEYRMWQQWKKMR